MLSKPNKDDRIPVGTFGYFRGRNRMRVYTLVVNEFKKSGISQRTLAHRLGKGEDQVSKWLGAPGNWTLDTVSDYLFAISGAEASYGITYPLDIASRNDNRPDWLDNAPNFDWVMRTQAEKQVKIDNPQPGPRPLGARA